MKSLPLRVKKMLEAYPEISAQINGESIILNGELGSWQQAVKAGQLAASKRQKYYIVNKIKVSGITPTPMRMPQIKDNQLEGKQCDVLIIGAGIIGCAAARELAKYSLDIVLIDKENDVAMHASSRNDGMVHPGVDLHKWQKKFAYNLRGNKMYDEICKELNVPFKRTGQYICVNKPLLAAALPLATLYWKLRGIPCKFVSRNKLLALEPSLNRESKAGLFFKTAGIVCPYGLTIAYAENAVDNGVSLYLNTAVIGMDVKENTVKGVKTNRGTIYPKIIVNAAGVFSDDIAKMANDEFFSIHPRKGTNAILDKQAKYMVNTIVSSIGTASTKKAHSKGGGIVSTTSDNVLVGPDAVETYEKENFATSADSVGATMEKQRLCVNALTQSSVITYFTGVRAASYEEDFIITKGKRTKNIVHAAAIQSPGLTAAPAIAADVAKMAAELLSGVQTVEKNKAFNPIRMPIPHTAKMQAEQRDMLIKQNPDYGEIVCRCEEISRGEIIAALHRSVPCSTTDAVKRRVRPGMGRCQGGFCLPLVAKIISEEKGIPIEQVMKSTDNSPIVYRGIKGGDKVE